MYVSRGAETYVEQYPYVYIYIMGDECVIP